MKRAFAAHALVGAMMFAPIAHAQHSAAPQSTHEPAVARIELFRAVEAAQCPDERALRAAVARRLGRDPFSADAAQRVRLAVGPDGAGLSLAIEMVGADGAVLGQRTIRSRTRDCVELAESAAVALVVAIDVLSLTQPPASPLASEPPRREAPPVTPPAERPSQPDPAPRTIRSSPTITPNTRETEALHGSLAINATSSLGDLPTIAFGGALRTGLRWRALGLVVEGRAMLPTMIDGPQGSRIESSLYTGSALACFHRQWFSACGVGAFGALLARGSNVDRPREPTIAVVAAGARAGGWWRVPGDFFIDASLEVLASLLRPALTINATTAWDAPPLQASVRIGLGVELR